MLIAELAQSHNGDTTVLFESIDAARDAGAWAVKIQSFFADDLSEDWRHEYDRLKKLELSWEVQEEFVKRCRSAGVTPMTSVYAAKHIENLKKCGFRYLKIGSAQCTKDELINDLNTAGFHVIVSTGGTRDSFVTRMPVHAKLHCVSAYPSDPHDCNLKRMIEISSGVPYFGLSCHADPMHRDWDMPSKLAMFLGADYIEKHFSILPRQTVKDGPVNLDWHQLKDLCEFDNKPFKEKRILVGNFKCLVSPQKAEERQLIAKYRGRWVD